MEKIKQKPEGPFSAETTLIKHNSTAIYYTIVLKDKNGNRWETQNASFLFDLQPILGE